MKNLDIVKNWKSYSLCKKIVKTVKQVEKQKVLALFEDFFVVGT